MIQESHRRAAWSNLSNIQVFNVQSRLDFEIEQRLQIISKGTSCDFFIDTVHREQSA